jgi:hypothetical protein
MIVCVTMRLCFATNKIRSFSFTYKDDSTILKVMRNELNSRNVIEFVVWKNVKRVKIGKEIKGRIRQNIHCSVPRGCFDYCSIQTLYFFFRIYPF